MRCNKRHDYDEEANHDRWLVSYADFITLMFAFFVVMYSISSISEGKYRVLSDALMTAFDVEERATSSETSPIDLPVSQDVPFEQTDGKVESTEINRLDPAREQTSDCRHSDDLFDAFLCAPQSA